MQRFHKLKGGVLTERWEHRMIAASDADEIIFKIRDLKLYGKFRVYPRDQAIVVEGRRVEVYEFERLK